VHDTADRLNVFLFENGQQVTESPPAVEEDGEMQFHGNAKLATENLPLQFTEPPIPLVIQTDLADGAGTFHQ
jgi:hypothetical protein